MRIPFRTGRRLGVGWALGLVTAVGCAPSATTSVPAGSAAGVSAAAAVVGADGGVSSADDPNAVPVASAIRKVTVYSDRALVSRQGTIALPATPTVYAFRQLPGWVDEGSVRAAISAGRIVDVRVGRSYLARATEPRIRQAEEDARALRERRLALDDELAVLAAQAKQVEDIKAFSLDRLNKDVAAGGAGSGPRAADGSVGVQTYAGVVDFIAEKLRGIAQGRRRVQAEREKLGPAIEASEKLLEELRGLTQLEETNVFVTVQGGPGGPADGAHLELTYLLPGATWESAHEVRTAEREGAPVEVRSFAVVAQASGEDWDGAELTFSTQSSTAATRIPELEALTLGDTPAATRTIETRSASFRRAEAAFAGQNRLWNKRAQSVETSREFEESYQANFESLQVTQSKTVSIFQSLQRRGTTAQFKATSPARVRADGRAVRVPIGQAELKAVRAIVAAPEQSLNAAQTLELRNDSGQALLPGAVAMYQGGAFLGMTNLDFVADGEPFALFLNVADAVKISRVLDRKRSSLVRKQRTQMQLAFVVTVENLSNQVTSLRLSDRIPVSEDADIVIRGVRIAPDVKPDSKGILRWPVTLQPKEKRTYEIQYQVEYPPTLVLEMQRRSAPRSSPAAPVTPGESLVPAPDGSDLKQEIQRLEQML